MMIVIFDHQKYAQLRTTEITFTFLLTQIRTLTQTHKHLNTQTHTNKHTHTHKHTH